MEDGRIKFGLNDESSPKRKLFYAERLEKGDCKTPSSILLDAGTTKSGTTELMELFDGEKVFDYPKPSSLLSRLLKYGFVKDDDIIMDFFSGSGTTLHGLFNYSIETKHRVKCILVQYPENLDETIITANNDAKKTIKTAIEFLTKLNVPHTICEIAKERIRRAGKKIKADSPLTTQDLDIGFRVLKCDESNFKPVAQAPMDYKQEELDMYEDNIKEERNGLDLLFDCMMRWGLELSLPYTEEKVDECTIYNVDDGTLVACLEANAEVTESVIDAIAQTNPVRIVFRDSSFKEAAQKMNLFELFKQKCGWTDQEVKNNVRVI